MMRQIKTNQVNARESLPQSCGAASEIKYPNGGTMLTFLVNFLKNEEGQSLAEYALILVLVSIAAIAAMTTLGTDISGTFTDVSGTLSGS